MNLGGSAGSTHLHADWAVITGCLSPTEVSVLHTETQTVATRITVEEIVPPTNSVE